MTKSIMQSPPSRGERPAHVVCAGPAPMMADRARPASGLDTRTLGADLPPTRQEARARVRRPRHVFFDELFTLHPATRPPSATIGTTTGGPTPAGRAAGPARIRGSVAHGVRRPRPGRAVADDRIVRDLILGALDASVFGEVTLLEDAWDPIIWVYFVGRACTRSSPASSPRWPNGWRRSRAGWRGSPRSSRAPGRPSAASPSGRSRSSTPKSPASRRRGGRPGQTGRRGGRGGARRRDGPLVLPRLRAASAATAKALATREIPGRRGGACRHRRRGGSARSCSPRSWHTMRDPTSAGGDPRPCRGGVRGDPRGDVRDGPRRVASEVPRPPAPRRRGRRRSARCWRSGRAPGGRRARADAREDAASRRSAASAASSACPTTHCRSSGRPSSCAPRWRDLPPGPLDKGQRRSSSTHAR